MTVEAELTSCRGVQIAYQTFQLNTGQLIAEAILNVAASGFQDGTVVRSLDFRVPILRVPSKVAEVLSTC